VPEHVGTYGDEILEFGREILGLEFDPEQEQAINVLSVHDKAGNPCAAEQCVIQPRQNGKTNNILLPIALWDLFCGKPDLVIWTAHRFKTSTEAFEAIQKTIDGNGVLSRRVKRITAGNGEEAVHLNSGAALYFLARSKSGGRGLGGKRIILDEAFALQAGQLGAILPTTLARPHSQIMYASSAGLEDSEPLREVRDRGRAGNDDGLAYIEWCAPGDWLETGCRTARCNHHRSTAGCALDREDYVQQANPAYGRRITSRAVATMRRSLPPQEFGREVLGWWDLPDLGDVPPIKIERWMACVDPLSKIEGAVAISFDVSRDRDMASVAVSGKRADGIDHGELVRYERGTEWVVDEIARLAEKWPVVSVKVGDRRRKGIICDPSGPAAALLPDLERRRIRPVLMSTREMGAACGGLQDAVTAGIGSWVHLGQPQVDIALQGAVRRDIGDGGWAFGRKRSADASVDISPLVAVTIARWGLSVSKPPAVFNSGWSDE
jgi:hypothetical protein